MQNKKGKNKKKRKEIGECLEELLVRLRKEKGWTHMEVASKLKNKAITEKDIKKWEIGLKYPDLDMIYELSELYQVSSAEIIQAKNNSYEKGMASINMYTIKWICYILNVSIYVGGVLLVVFYVLAFAFAIWFLVTMAGQVDKNLV